MLCLNVVSWLLLPVLAWGRALGQPGLALQAGDTGMQYAVAAFVGLAVVVVLLRIGLSLRRLGGVSSGVAIRFTTWQLLGLVVLTGAAEMLWQADRLLAAGSQV